MISDDRLMKSFSHILSLLPEDLPESEKAEAQRIRGNLKNLIGVEEEVPPVFSDVTANAFYSVPLDYCYEKGWVSGTGADTFAPAGSCVRAQVVMFLWRAAGSPEPTRSNNPFVDVKESDFFYEAVLWAVQNGITAGADATHFNPAGVCNRAQVVTFLWNACGKDESQSGEHSGMSRREAGLRRLSCGRWRRASPPACPKRPSAPA